jgi:hypothetical protein
MTKLYVTEYSPTPLGTNLAPEPGADQVVDYTAGAAASTAFKANTGIVRVHTDAVCSVLFGTAPTATTSNKRMAAGATEYFSVPMGQAYKVSAITNT